MAASDHVVLNIKTENSMPKQQLVEAAALASYRLFRFFCLFLIIIIIIIFLVALPFFLYYTGPVKVDFHVTHASVTQFNFTAASAAAPVAAATLHYNLTLTITVQNPNNAYGVYYEHVEAVASYKNHRFGLLHLNPFYQPQSNTTILTATFQGQQLLVLGVHEEPSVVANNSGVYEIDVKLNLRNKYSTSATITDWHTKPTIECSLMLTMIDTHSTSGSKSSSSSGGGGGFESPKCNFDFGFLYPTFSSHKSSHS